MCFSGDFLLGLVTIRGPLPQHSTVLSNIFLLVRPDVSSQDLALIREIPTGVAFVMSPKALLGTAAFSVPCCPAWLSPTFLALFNIAFPTPFMDAVGFSWSS